MNNKLKISLSEPLIRFKETGSIFNAPYFPRCEIDNHRLWVSDDSVRPLGRFCDQKPYKYQDNPFSVEYLFTYNFAGQINMTNFKMHPSWEKANVVIRIWGAWIDHNTRIMKGKWHLLYEVSHSKDPSESYKECSELITSIRIELNGNFLMYPEFIESLTNHCEVEEPTYFPLFFPLHKVLYEGVQILTHNVVPKIEANSNGENFTEYLPNEILYNIFNHLDLRSLSRCAQVNKRWNSITSDPRFYQEMDLKMYWYKFSIDTVEKLKEKFQIVRKLDLTWFTNMAYPVLYNKQEKLQYNAILIKLELGSWKRLTDEDLVPILTQCKKLSYLYIPHTPKITSWALTLACDNLPKLRHICIFSCEKISTEMVEDLAEIYKHVNFYQKKKWTEPI
ncbi:hypothetical protein ABEB36_010710 [Hypothenemus hampei]|uniref:F-box domain-containing protein n=1 Tax=Hypothenemus hampei TaxID=57062 RepID=A0ABD1ECS9_HYPHA